MDKQKQSQVEQLTIIEGTVEAVEVPLGADPSENYRHLKIAGGLDLVTGALVPTFYTTIGDGTMCGSLWRHIARHGKVEWLKGQRISLATTKPLPFSLDECVGSDDPVWINMVNQPDQGDVSPDRAVEAIARLMDQQ